MTRVGELGDVRSGLSRVWQSSRTAVKWLLLVALLAAVLTSLAAVTYDVWGSIELRAARAAAAGRGLPLSYDEWLRKRPEIPDAQNAALYYEAAFSLMQAKGLPTWCEEVFPEKFETVRTESTDARTVQAALRDPRQPLPGEVLADIKVIVESRRDIIDAVHSGAAFRQSSYRVDLAFHNKPAPHFEPMRTTVPLVALSAWVDAEEGKGAEAIGRVTDALALARSFSGQPNLAFIYRENQGVSTALRVGLTRVLARAHVAPSDLAELQDFLQEYDGLYPGDASLEGILALDCDMRLALWQGRQSLQEEGTNVIPAFLLRGYLKTDEALLLGYFLDTFVAPKPTQRPSRFYIQACVRSTHFDEAAKEIAATRALLRCAATALAAERFKEDNGKWPDALVALVPEYLSAGAEDPFTGRGLFYARDDTGVIVYSAGPNRIDDSGRPDLANVDPTDSAVPGGPDDVGVRLWQR